MDRTRTTVGVDSEPDLRPKLLENCWAFSAGPYLQVGKATQSQQTPQADALMAVVCLDCRRRASSCLNISTASAGEVITRHAHSIETTTAELAGKQMSKMKIMRVDTCSQV